MVIVVDPMMPVMAIIGRLSMFGVMLVLTLLPSIIQLVTEVSTAVMGRHSCASRQFWPIGGSSLLRSFVIWRRSSEDAQLCSGIECSVEVGDGRSNSLPLGASICIGRWVIGNLF